MVFESIVVDLLNRILGDYFENLDTSQLKLGIWGGDVVLKDLVLKSSAIDDLGLPFKIVIGKLGKLTMKIPWSSIYTAPVELELKNLYLLVVPSQSVQYNEQTEESAAQAAKQAELARIDEIRKKEQLKKSGGETPPPPDTFAEKLITQIIKNVQIRIASIHIRYEDTITQPSTPFSCGAILKELHVTTTDSNWKVAIITETVNVIHKMAKLDGLSVYWNSELEANIISKKGSKEEMFDMLEKLVDEDQRLTHVLGPIVSEAKVKLTPSPEKLHFSQSKIIVDVDMKELAIGLTNRQFQDAMAFAESLEFMSKAQYYRKYRPQLTQHRGHYKAWWKFAYRSIVEEDVRRKQLNWDWEHIKQHRQLVKVYADAYYQKLTAKKPKPEIDAKVAQCEKALDVFNITLVRKQVEMRVDRQESSEKQAAASSGGWFSGWFGGSSSNATDNTSNSIGLEDITKKFGEALTPEEKKKLYSAIDYTEGTLQPMDWPENYLEYQLNFHLHTLKSVIRDAAGAVKNSDTTVSLPRSEIILNLEVNNVETIIATRPYKNGFKLDLNMGGIEALGVQRSELTAPHLISSKSATIGVETTTKLIEISFETNPLNSTASQRIVVNSAPVEIVYHSKTIVELVRCFTLPAEMQLSKLQAATLATINEWKESSAVGLQHLIETRGELDINVNFMAPYLVIPQGGAVSLHGSSLVMDLGSIELKSKPRNRDKSDISRHTGKTKDEILQLTLEKSYDSFLLTLKDFQILLALPGDDFRSALRKASTITKSPSSMQLITSKELIVQLDQSLVPDDPQLPKLKISGELPLLDMNITETRLLELVKLLVTLPFPQTAPPQAGGTEAFDTPSHNPNLAESVAVARITYSEIQKKHDLENVVQFTDLVLMFSVSAIKLGIQRATGPKKDVLSPLADFQLQNIHCKMTSKTFGTGIDVRVGGITLCASSHSAPGIPRGQLFLLKTPMTESDLLNLKMFSISADCPPKYSTRVKQEMTAEVSTLDLILHQEALGTLITFVTGALESFNSALTVTAQATLTTTAEVNEHAIYTVKKDEKKHISKLEASMKAVAKKHTDSKDILLSFKAHLNRLTVQLSTETKNITKLVLGKLDMSYEQRPKKANMSLELTEFNLLNLDPKGFYKKIVSQDNESEKVIYVHCTMHDEATKGDNFMDMTKHDMKVKVETGSPKIVYLSTYVDEILNFVDNFQLAKDAVVDASAAAAAAARENVENVYTSGSRILIDVELKTPQIIIPRNTQSSSALQANLGNLFVKNEFKIKKGTDTASIVILDEIHAVLDSMEMSRIIVDKASQGTIAQCLLLDPVTLRLIIQRNMSNDWYHEIPNIWISGEMEETSIRCSSEDYEILMACLTENVGASGKASDSAPHPPSPAKPAIASASGASGVDKSKRKDSKVGESAVVPLVDVLAPKSNQPIYTNVEVQLKIKQTSLVLYDGSSELSGKKGLVQRLERSAFAKFAIDNINLDLTLLSNSNMNCNLGIHAISLEDIRPGNREINNLIRRNLSSTTLIDPETDVIKVTFRTDVDTKQGTTMILEITSMTFVLCLDYLLKIAAFFATSSGAPSHGKPADLSVKYEQFPTAGDPAKVRELTPAKPKPQQRKDSLVQDQDPKDLPFKLFFTMAETDVILVETMEKIETNALLLNCEGSVKIIIDSGKTNIMGSINNIRLSTCVYDPEIREKSLAEVISPMSITLVMNTSVLVGTLIDINISDIFIRLTAGTLELLLKISSSISSNAPVLENEEIRREDFSDLWNIKPNENANLWYLKPDVNVEVGVDALAGTSSDTTLLPSSSTHTTRIYEAADDLVVKERIVLESGSIVLTFETGMGTNTTPVLLIESDIDMQGFDWSEKLHLSGRLKLEVAYYNPVFGMWEFLVEPVETKHNGKVSHRPWEIFFDYQILDNQISSGTLSPLEESTLETSSAKTYASVSLQSLDVLELTVTKTSLDVINMLTSDFQEAVKSLVSQKDVIVSPYTIVNHLGTDVKVTLAGSTFVLIRRGLTYEEALIKHNTALNLSLADAYDMTKHHNSILKEQEGREERVLGISIEEFNFSAEVPVNRADKRYYGLKKKTSWKGNYAIVVDTTVKDTSKVVTLRGLVQVYNHLRLPVNVYYMDDSGNSIVLAGTVKKEEPLNLPLSCLYTKSSEIYFAPEGYNVSTMPFVWTVLLRDAECTTHSLCRSKDSHSADFHIKVVGEVKPTLYEATNRKSVSSNSISIHLKPPLIIDNLLPVGLAYVVGGKEVWAEQGHSIHVSEIDVGVKEEFALHLKIKNYNGKSWKSLVSIDKSVAELSPWEFIAEGNTAGSTSPAHSMFLGIHKESIGEIMTLHVYCPFWMVNRTGLTLAYAEDIKAPHPILHSDHNAEPIFFSFRGKSFLNSKKKAVVRVEGKSDWSTKFSLDVAGSGGSVICKSPLQDFEIGIEIVLNSWGLTKSVVFTPRYYLINQCNFILEVTENERSRIKIEQKACIPFWPKSKDQRLLCRIDHTNDFTKKFSYEKSDQMLLQLPNKFGGVHVDVHITEASHLITFSEYLHGQAPVLIVNTTKDNIIEVTEKGSPDTFKRIIFPGMNQLLTWFDPMGEKTIIWSPQTSSGRSSSQFTDKLHGDGYGSYKWTGSDNREREYHWVSFLDGLQRVLLFTPDKNLVSFLQTSRDMEYPIADYTIHLHGIGLSLVDNVQCVELLYLRIASSEVQWESQKPGKRQRFKPLQLKKSCLIESAYQTYLNEKTLDPSAKSHRSLDTGIEIDFLNMTMSKPYERKIRRVFQTGAWFHYKTYPHTVLIHAKINRIQIDNQLPGCIFRTILAPVPPPRSVMEDDIAKPFAEVSIMERMTAHSSVIQYKYFKVLIQEFHVKMDISFVNALMSLFSEEGEKKLEKMVEYFDKDYTEATLDSETYMSRRIVSQGQKNFYDYLHFSPLKIHLSFSMGGATQLSNSFLNLLIASLGVSVTEVQDVVFKLACIELQHLFMTRPQLLNEAYSHYSSQAIQQLYVLVLGLDVIGNPYGLLVGFTQGVGAFFYEPFHGAIQGPGEFMEGLTLGIRSLFGHTIGGMSGAMSKITGTFGKGVAALTLDDEYQKKRRENLSKRQTAADGFVESGKDLVMGFVDGFTGVFTKPVQGAKKDGAGGFFKGLGKGALGLVTRPAAGVIDFTSGSFDAVKKATSVSDEVQRMRPPRYIPNDTVLQPYVLHEAEGMQLFNDVDKGKYTTTESYVAHALINPHGVYVLLLTTKRILYLKKIDVFGGWAVQWTYPWHDFEGPPEIIERGLKFRLKPRDKRETKTRLLPCQDPKNDVLVPLYSAEVCAWILGKIETAMRTDGAGEVNIAEAVMEAGIGAIISSTGVKPPVPADQYKPTSSKQ